MNVGRPRIGEEVRNVQRVRVEPRHLDAIRAHNLSLSEVIEAVADCLVAANTQTRVAKLLRALDLE